MWCSVVLLSLQFKSRSPGKRVVRGIGGRVDTRMFGFREGRIDKINGCSWFIHSRPKRCAAAKGNQIWTVSEAHVKAVTLILRKAKATAKANAAAAAPKLKQRSNESSGSCKSPAKGDGIAIALNAKGHSKAKGIAPKAKGIAPKAKHKIPKDNSSIPGPDCNGIMPDLSLKTS